MSSEKLKPPPGDIRGGMKKILVIGSSGAGKSTFAKRLSRVLNVEVIHLDAHYWRPGWVEPPRDVWRETLAKLLRRDAWVMDGNYGNTLEQRLEACDTVVFLDLPRTLCVRRVIKRWIIYWNRSRPDMAEGCREKVDWSFIRWIWNYPTRSRPRVVELLKAESQSRRVVRLRSQAEVDAFLKRLSERG